MKNIFTLITSIFAYGLVFILIYVFVLLVMELIGFQSQMQSLASFFENYIILIWIVSGALINYFIKQRNKK